MDHIKREQDQKVKALLCKGTAKMVLAGMITDVDVNAFQHSGGSLSNGLAGSQKSD